MVYWQLIIDPGQYSYSRTGRISNDNFRGAEMGLGICKRSTHVDSDSAFFSQWNGEVGISFRAE